MIQLLAGLLLILSGSILVGIASRPQTFEVVELKKVIRMQEETIKTLMDTAALNERNFAKLRDIADSYKLRAEHPENYGHYAPPWHDAQGNPIPDAERR